MTGASPPSDTSTGRTCPRSRQSARRTPPGRTRRTEKPCADPAHYYGEI